MAERHKKNVKDIDNSKIDELSALDKYLNRVYKFVVLAPTTVAMMSAVSYTMSKFIGDYKGISTIGLIFFDLTNAIYFITALFLYHTGLNGSELVKMKKIKLHKILVGIGIITQYNFTAYLIPYRDWWVFAPFFIFLLYFSSTPYTQVLFQDSF